MELANFKPNKQTWIYIACFAVFLITATLIIIYTQNDEPVSEEVTQEKSEAISLEQPVASIEYEASSTNATSSEIVATENTKIPTKPEIKTEATITPPPKIIPKPVSNSFSSVFLEKHNAVRGALSLTPLTWSLALAKEAQAWSEVLKGEGCKMRHDYSTEHGENIYWESQSGGDISELISSPSDAVYYWAEEKKHYDYKTNSCEEGEVCGHYTQLVWSDTTTVGCGVSSCTKGESRTDIWVCRYDPAGNIIGDKPY